MRPCGLPGSGDHQRATGLVAIGIGAAIAGRGLLRRGLLVKFRRDVAALNRGDYRPLLTRYAPGAVLRFNDADHRWAGEHRGSEAIGRFFENFVAAGIQGEIVELFAVGPLWKL